MAGFYILRAALSVLLRRRVGRVLACGPLLLIEQVPQVGAAPAAAGAGAETLAELPWAARLRHADEVDHLALGDVEAEAEFVVEVHT